MDSELKKQKRREYYLSHREKMLENNKRWRENNPDKAKEVRENWNKNNLDKVKEMNKKSHEKFKSKVDWNKYCSQAKKRRVQRLREQGVKNAWAVANKGDEPIYINEQ